MRFVSLINYIFLAVVMLMPPIRALFLPFIKTGQIQLLFATIAFLASMIDKNFRNCFHKAPFIFWFFWVIFSIINWKTVGLKSNLSDVNFIFSFILLTFVTLLITYYELQNNMKQTVLFLCVVFFVYLFLGLTNQGALSFADERGGMTLGNDMPLVACTALFLSAFGYRQGYNKLWLFLLFLVLSLVSTLYVAERKTFIVTLVITVFTLIPIDSLKKPSRWIPILLFVFLSYKGIEWILDNTLIGERFAETTDQSSLYTDNFFLSLMGDRASHYVGGWPLFLSHPITGIGLRNYPIVTFTQHPLHTEYMVQLVEGGILGAFLFLAFAISIIRRWFRARLHPMCNRQAWSVCFGELLSLFLLCFITWTYDSPHYFIAIAVIISFSNQYYYDKLQE